MSREPEKRSTVNGRWQAMFFGTLLVMVVLLEVLFLPSSTQDLPYSQFKQLVQTGQVADLKIGATTIHGTLLDKTATPSPETTALAQPERFGSAIQVMLCREHVAKSSVDSACCRLTFARQHNLDTTILT
jgi:FtsH Extracellular